MLSIVVHLKQNITREVRARRTYVSDTCGTLYKVAIEAEKTTYYPEKIIDRMKITTRRRKIEIKIEKDTHTSKREEREKNVQARQGKNIKQEIKKGNTQENGQFFADCRLARFARGVEQR